MDNDDDKKSNVIKLFKEGTKPRTPRKKTPTPPTIQVNGDQAQVALRDINHHHTTIHPEKVVHKTIVKLQLGDEHISPKQADTLKTLVNQIVDLEGKLKQKPKKHGVVWSALNLGFN